MSVITVDNKIYDEMAAYAQMNNLSINEAVTVGLRAFLRNFKKSEVAPKKKYYISSAVKALETNFK